MAPHVWLHDLNHAIGVAADLISCSMFFVIIKLGLIKRGGGGGVEGDIFLIPNKKRHL